ncbi:glycoside hydrolase family 5 protein [Pelagicoccus mobilis]|uniref:Cellulase family glycosylhydrolase n=1 Tax=Pelagicoccus mobilis TaxID=415221 RepID=A0A934VND4_9BACT|nr:cellulase family glycosylhydrolase [Pelagicoccus mobilis]MBK1876112.1 cellulase family glycosylhydrolase [Pelagicoccus mobilis]
MNHTGNRLSGRARARGFNLQEKFNATLRNDPFREEDFELMAEWGFDFVRLPMSYHCWSSPENWTALDEGCLKEIDQAVAWGQEYGIHVSLNFHRAPGYSVNRSVEEPFCLWTDDEALEAFCYHWRHFAERYQDVGDGVSFDLLNEPAFHAPGSSRFVSLAEWRRVYEQALAVIREVSPERVVLVEGGAWGSLPVGRIDDPFVWQSAHLYSPLAVTHWRAPFIEIDWTSEAPDWPWNPDTDEDWEARAKFADLFYGSGTEFSIPDESNASVWDAARFRRRMRVWADEQRVSGRVHVGEFGVFNETPHGVSLEWLSGALDSFREAELGWALWELRGPFGVLDSERKDVAYEDFKGMRLDRRMLELLKNG